MDAEEYKRHAHDHEQWFRLSEAHQHAAGGLWEQFVPGWKRLQSTSNPDEKSEISHTIFQYLPPAVLLYGYAIETALKGRLVRDAPDKINFKEKTVHDGNVTDIQLMPIGSNKHDLRGMAGQADALPKRKEDRDAIGNVLDWLSVCVRWRSRYPVPHTQSAFAFGLPRNLTSSDDFVAGFRSLADGFLADIRLPRADAPTENLPIDITVEPHEDVGTRRSVTVNTTGEWIHGPGWPI